MSYAIIKTYTERSEAVAYVEGVREGLRISNNNVLTVAVFKEKEGYWSVNIDMEEKWNQKNLQIKK